MKRAAFTALVVFASLLIFPNYASASTTYTFTNAAATGNTGPTQAQINTAYTSTTLANSVTINTQGIQEWTVPFSGQFRITVRGAAGGNGFSTNSQSGGFGAQTIGTFSLTSGTVLKILVGQRGGSRVMDGGGGGGGGSFVVTGAGTILAIAGGGGGGGGRNPSTGVNASLTTTATRDGSGAGTAGTSGGGGSPANTTWCGAGAGGYSGNGLGFVNCASVAGRSFTNGGAGGAATGTFAAAGGFGGGGGVGYSGGGGGGYNGAPGGTGDEPYPGGGGGSTFNSGSNVTTSQLNTLADGGVTIQSIGPSLTTFAPRSTIDNQTTIIYDISFSEAVTGLAAADFSRSGTGSSTCTVGTPLGSGPNYTVTLSGCSPGTVILTIATNAVTNTSSQTAPSSSTAAATVTIDQTLPTISGTLTGPANATYIPGQSLTFTAPFSETVTVTGTPRLALIIGSTTRYANYFSGTNTRTLTFTYVVQTALADIDADGISLSTSLEPNSGSIQDLATNTLSNFTFTAPNLTSVLVAQRPAAPTIDSITATSGQLAIAFTPGSTNGSAITNYEFSTNNGLNWTTRNPVATTSPFSITGLTNGQAYNVRLRAINAAGTGDSSTAVAATPSAVVVSGDSTLASTYGQSASTGSYSATGGTGGYTFSLSDTPTGVTIDPSNGTVTTATTTPAGTYTQSVRATDSSAQVGTRSLTITVNKAATSITISLPNSATSAALGGAVTITATVPRAGAVNFRLGGTTLTGCGAATVATTTATCSWTPLALGSVALTAIFTPTDTSNFETSTTTTLIITVVNGVSTVSLSLAGGVTQVPKGQAINIIAAIDQVGRITFLVDGKRIPGCFYLVASVIGNRSCSWKPSVQRAVNISARLVPTNNVFNPSVSSMTVQVVRRSGAR